MTQKSINIFKKEVLSKPPKKNYPTNKTDVYHIDHIWSLKLLDLKNYGPKSNRDYRYVLVPIDKFSKFGWSIPLEIKNAQTKTNSFENTLLSSKSKPNLIETDRGKQFYNSVFQNVFNNNNIKHYSRKSSIGDVFAECFNCTFRDLLMKPVFEKGESNWIDVLSLITKQ